MEWVNANLLKDPTVAKNLLIAEVGYGAGAEDYKKGHIPNAIYINSDEIEYDCFSPRENFPVPAVKPPCYERSTTPEEDASKGLTPKSSLPRNLWNYYSLPHLRQAFVAMGISADKTVLLYSKDPTPSARVLMGLRYAGVNNVFILDGGYQSWLDAGRPGQMEPVPRKAVAAFGEAKQDPAITWYSTPQIRQIVQGGAAAKAIIDVRAREEYTGATHPYDYIPTAGRIPGAIYAHGSVKTPWEVNFLVDEKGKIKPKQEIMALWNSDGVPRDKELIFYCGTGWRAALGLLVAESLGWKKLGYYDGGWMEWSMGPEAAQNPTQKD